LPRASQAVRQNQNRSPLPQASPGADRRCIHKALRVTAILLTPLPIALAEPGARHTCIAHRDGQFREGWPAALLATGGVSRLGIFFDRPLYRGAFRYI
jgi:hypothetical protein